MSTLLEMVSASRIASDTLQLVNIPSPTGDTCEIATNYEALLKSVGCTVERYEFVPNNPTLVATYGDVSSERTILFSGHMDTIPLPHESACIKDGRIYGRGACDMKGSLACIVETIRILNNSNIILPGKLVIVANSLHESPGGRGEDLIALTENINLRADAAVVMEGATYDCTIAQFGSATFEISIQREGESSHQLYTLPGTPHPITVAADVIQQINKLNLKLETEYIEDIGFASYFIGSVHSGQFYNQHPNKAEITGVRRYSPQTSFEVIEQEMLSVLNQIAEDNRVQIDLDLKKVRDGYRIDKNDFAVSALVNAFRKVRNSDLPLAGKKIVTDAGIFVNNLGIPTLCHGPDQRTAHGDIEYVDISELELTVQVYLQFIIEFLASDAEIR